jgi:integrase
MRTLFSIEYTSNGAPKEYIIFENIQKIPNIYQTRHTYASMMLSAGGELFVGGIQMGHKDTEMIIKHYGRWIPNKSTVANTQS